MLTIHKALITTFAALTLSATTIAADAPTGSLFANVLGLTAGSIWALTNTGGAPLAKSGDMILTTGPLTVGAYSLELTETLAEAANSPRVTTIPITVTVVSEDA